MHRVLVFFLYDYIITIGREVDLFWSRKITGASVLFLFIRYGTLVYKVLDLVSFGPMSDKVRLVPFVVCACMIVDVLAEVRADDIAL